MMYWGGEYQVDMKTISFRRAGVHANSIHVANHSPAATTNQGLNRRGSDMNPSTDGEEPKLDFRVIAGAPLRSK